jgi:hypothetical protein
MKDPMIRPAKSVLFEHRVRIGREIAICEIQQFDAGDKFRRGEVAPQV